MAVTLRRYISHISETQTNLNKTGEMINSHEQDGPDTQSLSHPLFFLHLNIS